MPYTLIKGEFILFSQSETRKSGSQPDGDSLRFKPSKQALLENILDADTKKKDTAKFNAAGLVQLRFEGIDALEIHYAGGNHQEINLATEARDITLKNAGFKTVEFTGKSMLTAKSAVPHPLPGYILTRSIDPYGRPVSFVFAGDTPKKDGDASVFLDTTLLMRSLNYKLTQSGNAYPAFYTGMPTDLRRSIIKIAANAKQKAKGLWSKDTTLKPNAFAGMEALNKSVVWPKLYRRLATYFKEGHNTISEFEKWIREKPDRDDALWIISSHELANLHDVVSIKSNKISMIYTPEDLIIVPRK